MTDQPAVACGNPAHPDGPWHPAAPVPGPRAFREGAAQRLRRRAYGCGCPASGRIAYAFGRLAVSTVLQPAGSPLISRGRTVGPRGSGLIVRSIVIVPPWRLRISPGRRLRTRTTESALVLGRIRRRP